MNLHRCTAVPLYGCTGPAAAPCVIPSQEYFSWAAPAEHNPLIAHFARLAAELQVVLPGQAAV